MDIIKMNLRIWR